MSFSVCVEHSSVSRIFAVNSSIVSVKDSDAQCILPLSASQHVSPMSQILHDRVYKGGDFSVCRSSLTRLPPVLYCLMRVESWLKSRK